MKVVRYAEQDASVVGIVDGDRVLPLGAPFDSVGAAIADPAGARESADESRARPLAEVRLLAPLDPGARVFAVAQNYPQHAQEVSGTAAPPSPVVFTKLQSAMVGPADPIELAPVTDFLDYEAEMAVMIGREGYAVSEEEARGLVAGVTCLNDGSARDLLPVQIGGKDIFDWFSGKSLDNTSPIGPWVVTTDELPGYADLELSCYVNGERVQHDRTSSMVFSSEAIASFVSQRVRLLPGDVIATGTPAGVGRYRGVKLADGDLVEVELEGVGRLSNRVRARPRA